jgi:hypothetical protein
MGFYDITAERLALLPWIEDSAGAYLELYNFHDNLMRFGQYRYSRARKEVFADDSQELGRSTQI